MTATILGILFGFIGCLVAYAAGMALLDLRDRTKRDVAEILAKPHGYYPHEQGEATVNARQAEFDRLVAERKRGAA